MHIFFSSSRVMVSFSQSYYFFDVFFSQYNTEFVRFHCSVSQQRHDALRKIIAANLLSAINAYKILAHAQKRCFFIAGHFP
jgi:hypothetical protein